VLDVAEGLRDRKKRLLRQLISDTATELFLDRGFDEVTVSEIAAACDVSEKTVFNYFPTKESLLLDREDHLADLIVDTLRDRGDGTSIGDATVAAIELELVTMAENWRGGDATAWSIQRFAELVETTPTLLAAQQAMMERLTQVAATALAERAGVDPDDPEPQMAALLLLGLWRTQYGSLRRHALPGAPVDDVLAAVRADVRRAARVADAGLSSFLVLARGSTTKEQLLEAADAANEARRQVMAAVKQARELWRQVVDEARAQQLEAAGVDTGDLAQSGRELRMRQQEMREQIREYQRAARMHAMEAKRASHEAKRRAQQARRDRRGGSSRP